MKSAKIFLFIIIPLLLSKFFAFGQLPDTIKHKHQKKIIKRPAKRNIIWFTPTRANEINGLAIGTIPSSAAYNNDSLQIKGIHVELNPIMLMVVPYVVIGSFKSPFISEDTAKDGSSLYYYPDSIIQLKNTISGLNLSFLGSGEMIYYNGITISSLATMGRSLKGISITFGQNNFYEFYGLMIAGLSNGSYKGAGLQIGLFNRCKECKGVQIGLLNRMGKRTLPLLNARF